MAAGEQEKIDFKAWMGIWGTMLGAFMAVLDIQITNASLREITGGIAATQDEGSWISTSYLIGEISRCPLKPLSPGTSRRGIMLWIAGRNLW
jgi:MFS transporter, DHA2 family, multidrug resistance protein